MDPIYEVRILSRGDQILQQMCPYYGEDDSLPVRYMHKGSCTVGQVQTPQGMQKVSSDFAFEIVASDAQEAFSQLPDRAAKAIKKCRADFKRQMTEPKLVGPNGLPLNRP